MKVLVFNTGSSSLKFGLFDGDRQILKGSFDRFRDGGCDMVVNDRKSVAPYGDLGAAIAAVPQVLADEQVPAPDAIGHRFVHGGPDFTGPALIDPTVIAAIEAQTPLAPLHNPAMLQAMHLAREVWADLPQVAVFDTSFHLTNPARATTYAVPAEWRAAGLRRGGFNGTTHKYFAQRAAEAHGRPWSELRSGSVQGGTGASACAGPYGATLASASG
ncbi:MAG: acetate kinase, partial [Paracoccus sp. (in: a-proteobacteria)]|nr:acetate kinase [Paracoccus sp. (in: a-proteobacteria)]